MLKSFKTEINPTDVQKVKIRQTFGVCRYVYNLFLEKNRELYSNGEKFMNDYDFSKWLNNEFVPNNPDKQWIKEVSSKSVRYSIGCANDAFMRFFKKQSGFPKFKKRDKSNVKMYFVRTNKDYVIECERHRIKIPTLGWVRLKEKGYIPLSTDYHIHHGHVSYKAGRYYVSVIIEISETDANKKDFSEGMGIDLGVKELAVCSNGKTYANINKAKKVRKLEKGLRREQRRFSRMIENSKHGGKTDKRNIEKQRLKIQKIYQRLDDIRTDYLNKVISEIVRTKPSFITIENLNVSGMMKNRHLSKAIKDQKLYEFRRKLTDKCSKYGIEVRVVSRFYPSSKTCHNCGVVKDDLKLSDRVYRCDSCGYVEDRDFNASLNLRDATEYKVA